MRIRHLLAPLPLLLAAAPAPPLMPGLWEETLVFALDAVNGSADLGAQMQSALPAPAPQRTCLSAAELADPADILLGAGDRRCTFTRFTMTGGRIAAAGNCAAGTQTLHVEGTGSYTPTGYDFSFTGTGNANGIEMAFRGRDSGRRIASCPAK